MYWDKQATLFNLVCCVTTSLKQSFHTSICVHINFQNNLTGNFSSEDALALFSHRVPFVLGCLFGIVLLSCVSITCMQAFMCSPFIHLSFPKSHHLLIRSLQMVLFALTCVGVAVTCIISRVMPERVQVHVLGCLRQSTRVNVPSARSLALLIQG